MDNILTNKYFCIAILIALAVVLYLYSQNKSCEDTVELSTVEPMKGVDLTPLSQELNVVPWATTPVSDGSNYGKTNTRFDQMADAHTRAKLIKNGFKVAPNLPTSYAEFEKYKKFNNSSDDVDDSDDSDDSENNRYKFRNRRKKVQKNFMLPRPLNDRPDLSQCQPCPPCAKRRNRQK